MTDDLFNGLGDFEISPVDQWLWKSRQVFSHRLFTFWCLDRNFRFLRLEQRW